MKFIFFIIPLFFISCVSKEGIFYKKPNCSENYGLYGTYYIECENYLIKFKNKKKPVCLNCK